MLSVDLAFQTIDMSLPWVSLGFLCLLLAHGMTGYPHVGIPREMSKFKNKNVTLKVIEGTDGHYLTVDTKPHKALWKNNWYSVTAKKSNCQTDHYSRFFVDSPSAGFIRIQTTIHGQENGYLELAK